MADLVAKKEEEVEKVIKDGEEDGDEGDDGPAPVRFRRLCKGFLVVSVVLVSIPLISACCAIRFVCRRC